MKTHEVAPDIIESWLSGDKIQAIKRHRERTGCSLSEAVTDITMRAEESPWSRLPVYMPSKPTKLCPKCQEILRTDKAKQCFKCGADWH
jgi:hypothetical protein